MPKILDKTITNKTCPICNITYIIDEGFWKSNKGYYNSYCKSCAKIRNKAWTFKNCTKVRQRSK